MSRRISVGVFLAAASSLFLWVNDIVPGKEKIEARINPSKAPGPAPEGMTWIPGGWFWMGNEDIDEALPVHLVYVDGFWMDKTEVTNDEFARFVKATEYVTIAERKPDPKDFPDTPAEKLKPFSIVFKQPGPNEKVDVENPLSWWEIRYGASWKHPEGPQSDINGRAKH